MPWWGWMIFGAFLLASELLGVDAGFFLVFIGLAAILTGFFEIVGIDLEPWVQWLTFAGFGLVLMVFFRKRVYQKLRGGGVGYAVGPAGDFVEMTETLKPGDTARLSYRGTNWTVINDGNTTVDKGSKVRISRVDGLTLMVNSGEEE